jgi:hypothetical protein
MSLKIHLNEIQIAIRGGQFPNEAAVSRGVVMRLLQALGWPVFETNIVWPRYRIIPQLLRTKFFAPDWPVSYYRSTRRTLPATADQNTFRTPLVRDRPHIEEP